MFGVRRVLIFVPCREAMTMARSRGKEGLVSAPTVRLLGISGSPRHGGNTDSALKYAEAVARTHPNVEFSTIYLRDHRIEPCQQCGNCNERTSPCEHSDDMTSIIHSMIDADGIIYGVPVHGFGMAHLMKIFIERAGVGYLRFKRPLANKVGGAIVVGRRYAHSQVHSQIVSNLLLNRMIVVGSGFPAVLFAGAAGEIKHDSEGLTALYCMVNRMVEMARIIKCYSMVIHGPGLSVPEENERNFAAKLAPELAAATHSL